MVRNDDGETGDHEVGYGKPPKHTRWSPGQSGNPRGRRKGSRSLKKDLEDALNLSVTITVNGRKRKGTSQALAMYALAMRAAAGDLRANKLLTELVLTVFGPGERGGERTGLSSQDQELLERFLERAQPQDEQEGARVQDRTGDDVGGDDHERE